MFTDLLFNQLFNTRFFSVTPIWNRNNGNDILVSCYDRVMYQCMNVRLIHTADCKAINRAAAKKNAFVHKHVADFIDFIVDEANRLVMHVSEGFDRPGMSSLGEFCKARNLASNCFGQQLNEFFQQLINAMIEIDALGLVVSSLEPESIFVEFENSEIKNWKILRPYLATSRSSTKLSSFLDCPPVFADVAALMHECYIGEPLKWPKHNVEEFLMTKVGIVRDFPTELFHTLLFGGHRSVASFLTEPERAFDKNEFNFSMGNSDAQQEIEFNAFMDKLDSLPAEVRVLSPGWGKDDAVDCASTFESADIPSSSSTSSYDDIEFIERQEADDSNADSFDEISETADQLRRLESEEEKNYDDDETKTAIEYDSDADGTHTAFDYDNV